MALAELAARRTAQRFQQHIQTLTPEQAIKAGEKAADAMYTYLQEGHLKALANCSMEEKIAALVKAVEEASKTEKGFLGKKGGVFEKPVDISPAGHRAVNEVRQDVQGLGAKVDLISAHAQIKFSLIKSVATVEEQTKAVASLRIKETFVGHTFLVTRSKKELKISSTNPQTLMKIGAHLTSTFDTNVVEDCDIENGVLTITARSSMNAPDLETILRAWLRIN